MLIMSRVLVVIVGTSVGFVEWVERAGFFEPLALNTIIVA
jgi:hypothetical protein